MSSLTAVGEMVLNNNLFLYSTFSQLFFSRFMHRINKNTQIMSLNTLPWDGARLLPWLFEGF